MGKEGKPLEEELNDTVSRWRALFEKNREVIWLENERLLGITRMLAFSCSPSDPSEGKIYIYLVDPMKRAGLILRGAEEIPTLEPQGQFRKKDEGPSYEGDDYYIPLLGACSPVAKTLVEVALKGLHTSGQPEGLDDEVPSPLWPEKRFYPSTCDKSGRGLPYIVHKNKAREYFQGDWGEKRETEKKAHKALEDQIPTDVPESENELLGTLVPVVCWAQARAAWLYVAYKLPETIIDIGPVIESLVLERFPIHCRNIKDIEDVEKRYHHLLEGCASLWKSKRIVALDNTGKLLYEIAYGSGVTSFDEDLKPTDPEKLESSFAVSETQLVFSVGECLPNADHNMSPALDNDEKDKFAKSINNLFPGLKHIVWDLDDNYMDFNQIEEVLRKSGGAISRAIVAGVESMDESKRALEATFAKGEEQKAKDILPDWAHAFNSYLLTIEAVALFLNDTALFTEVHSAADANWALTRWASVEKWRTANPGKHLRNYLSENPPANRIETYPGISFIVTTGMKHLLAKIVHLSGEYAAAVKGHWFYGKEEHQLEDFIIDSKGYIAKAQVRFKILTKLFDKFNLNISIDESSVTNLELTRWPNDLWIPEPELNTSVNFGTLLQFLTDELLFNAFKSAHRIDGNPHTPFIRINYEVPRALDGMGILEIYNSSIDPETTVTKLNSGSTSQLGRGINLTKRLAEILNVKPDEKFELISYKAEGNTVITRAYIPHCEGVDKKWKEGY